ncbi:hypothetical protein BwiPL1_58330 (plasmid) [Bacillus wiedmannii]|nr:hypothetical protein BwiPL1_58330 [Bacillus wiedmannii]
MSVLRKTIFQLEYPEVKKDTCVTGWTYVPCGSLWHPKMCKQNITLPCVKSRKSKFEVYAKLVHPESVEGFLKKEIERCHYIAAGVASNFVYAAATASGIVGPEATIGAAVGAVPGAVKIYLGSFWACIKSFNLSDALKRQINGDVKYETHKLSNWH